MITVIRKSLYQHAYLLIAAAWLYTISFLAVNYWNYNTAENRVQDKLQKKLHAFEAFMDQHLGNEQELKALISNTPDIAAKQALLKQSYGTTVAFTLITKRLPTAMVFSLPHTRTEVLLLGENKEKLVSKIW